MLLLAVLLPVYTTPVNASLELGLIAYDAEANGYTGPSTTLTLEFYYGGAILKASVSVNGADAYDAALLAIVGSYDTTRGVWVSLGNVIQGYTKSWSGSLNWESYDIRLKSTYKTGIIVTPGYGGCIVETSGYATFAVTHSTWWGLVREERIDLIPLTAIGIIWSSVGC